MGFFTNFFLFLIIILGAGCVSDNVSLNRISERKPFIVRFGLNHQYTTGANLGVDFCEDVKVDRFENIVCVGTTNGNFAETNNGSSDAIVVKLNKAGKVLWVFQLGLETSQNKATGADLCSGLAIDHDGNIYCGGDTTSTLAPSSHGPGGGTDAFIMKLTPDGKLSWIRQFGSAGTDLCNALTISSSGNLYCSGVTGGSLGDRIDGLGSETVSGSSDAFIAKFDRAGNRLWVRQTGVQSLPLKTDGTPGNTSGGENCSGLAVDPGENYVYCTGVTTGAYGDINANAPDSDIFFLRLNASDGKDPRSIQYGDSMNDGFYDSENDDSCRKLTIDRYGEIFCVGYTLSGISDVTGSIDVVVARVHSNFTPGPVYQFGLNKWTLGDSSADDYGRDITVDSKNNLVISGYTTGAFGETFGGLQDPFILKISTSGVPLAIYHFGTDTLGYAPTGNDYCTGIAVDSDDNIYCAGQAGNFFGEAGVNASVDVMLLRVNANGSL